MIICVAKTSANVSKGKNQQNANQAVDSSINFCLGRGPPDSTMEVSSMKDVEQVPSLTAVG